MALFGVVVYLFILIWKEMVQEDSLNNDDGLVGMVLSKVVSAQLRQHRACVQVSVGLRSC